MSPVFTLDRNSRLRISVFIALLVSMAISQLASSRNFGYPTWEHLLSDQGIFDDFYGVRDENPNDYYLQSPLFGTNPPGTLMLGRLYALFPDRAAIVVAAVGWALLSAWAVGLIAKRYNAIWFLAVSYPFWFAILRGNDDVYLLPGILLLAWSLENNKPEIFGVVVGLLALAEPYSLLFTIPLVFAGYIKQAVIPAVLVLSGWLSTSAFGARDLGLFIRLAEDSPKTYLRNMAFGDGGMLFGNSMFGLLKLISQNLTDLSANETVEFSQDLYGWYLPVAWAIIAVVIVVTALRDTTVYSLLLRLALLTCLLPPVVATYKLGILFGLLIYRLYRLEIACKRDIFETWLLVLIIIPKSYMIIYLPSGSITTLDSLLNPILMLLLLLMTMTQRQLSAVNRPTESPVKKFRQFRSGAV